VTVTESLRRDSEHDRDLERRIAELEALFEEARQRQRQRLRRRAMVLGVGALLAAGVGFVVIRTTGGGGTATTQPTPIASSAIQKPVVTYEKLETVTLAPPLPTERRISETWSTTSAPRSYRELVTVAGAAPTEIGAGSGHDKTLGAEQIVYLYSSATNTIYRTGFYLVSTRPNPALGLGPEEFFRTVVAEHRVHLEGTRPLGAHTVFVLRSFGRTDYIDTHTYLPVMTVILDGGEKIIQRVLAWKTLPATPSNLRLTRLAAAHRGARIRAAPPRIQALYPDIASWIPAGWGWRELLLNMTSN
jgi:hypothetical protein